MKTTRTAAVALSDTPLCAAAVQQTASTTIAPRMGRNGSSPAQPCAVIGGCADTARDDGPA